MSSANVPAPPAAGGRASRVATGARLAGGGMPLGLREWVGSARPPMDRGHLLPALPVLKVVWTLDIPSASAIGPCSTTAGGWLQTR